MTPAKGKILITKLNERLLSILIRDNQILSVQVHKQNDHAVGNIYVGRVQNVSRNIGAAFIDLGGAYLTFLPLSEARHALLTNRKSDGHIKTGDEVLVQIIKEPMKTKLAGVTTKISLSGKYSVVGMKTSRNAEQSSGSEENIPVQRENLTEDARDKLVQVSSKLKKRQQIRFRSMEVLQQVAERYQLIVRTNAGALEDETPLIAEVKALTDQLEHILYIADKRVCYSCLYTGKPDYIHFIENAYTSEYDEIVTDLSETYDMLQKYLSESHISVRFYEDMMLPLYKLYSLETRVKELLDEKVWLKSGAYLVIEPTEALVSIDVNSGKCEQGKDMEETFLKINIEAAEMIAIHLRARNLSGIILVDFINLKKKAHEQQLIEYMRRLLKKDSVNADVVDMTGLGLMEITRRKVNPSFREQYQSSARSKTAGQ